MKTYALLVKQSLSTSENLEEDQAFSLNRHHYKVSLHGLEERRGKWKILIYFSGLSPEQFETDQITELSCPPNCSHLALFDYKK